MLSSNSCLTLIKLIRPIVTKKSLNYIENIYTIIFIHTPLNIDLPNHYETVTQFQYI